MQRWMRRCDMHKHNDSDVQCVLTYVALRAMLHDTLKEQLVWCRSGLEVRELEFGIWLLIA